MACPTGPFITLFSEADTPSELAGGRALPHPREECSRDRVVGQTWAGACCVTWGLCDLGQDPGPLGSSCPGLWSGDSPSPFPRLFASGPPTPKEHGLPSKGLREGSVCLFIEVKFT